MRGLDSYNNNIRLFSVHNNNTNNNNNNNNYNYYIIIIIYNTEWLAK